MYAHVYPALLAALLAVSPAFAQQLDRRSRDEPEVVLNTGGRVGFCDTLRFSPDGKFLLAAGDDKAVTVWPILLNPNTPPQLNTARLDVKTLRWPSWREKRGGIKQLAVSPDGTRVAVGGLGLITSGVAVLNRAESTPAESVVEAYTWPKARPGKDDFGTVTAVAFDPDGKRVAFGTADGSLWVWTPAKLKTPDTSDKNSPPREWALPVRVGQHAPPKKEWDKKTWDPKNLYTRSRLVFFRGANELVSVSMSGQVVTCDTKAGSADPADPVPAANELCHLNPTGAETGRIFRAEPTADGKRVSVAFMGPRVRVCDLDGKNATDIKLPEDHMPWAVAVEPGTGRVAVAVGGAKELPEPRFYLERANAVWVYPAGETEPTVKLPNSGRAEAVAFHPTRKGLLAVAGGDADEVTLFDLDGDKPETPVSVARGAGRKPFAVAIGPGNTVAVKVTADPKASHPNALATGEWAGYDLSRQKMAGVGKSLSTAVNEADGWSILSSADDRAVWYAVTERNGAKVKAELRFDHIRYNDPTCYTFLPQADNTPTRLLVGHYHGCSLFELPAGDVPEHLDPKAVYVGHSTEVLSVAAATDGSWFITGGADQTVAAFSLKSWAAHPTLGAAFEVPEGKDEVRVTELAVGSPAWEAGLQKGDRVDRLVVGGRTVVYNRVIDDKLKANVGTPADAVAALSRPMPPGRELYFEVQAVKGSDPRRLTTVQQRPMWKWFAAFDKARISDSVVWMWKGSWYYAETAGGDELVGWHVNPPQVIGSPRFHRLREFEDIYLRPLIVRELLRDKNVATALTSALGENPQPPSFARYEPEPIDIALQRPRVGPKEKVQVRITVTPRGQDLDLLPDRVELWVNDYRYKTWQNPPRKTFDETVEIDAADLRAGDNQLTVMTYNPRGGRARDRDVLTNTASQPSNPTLVGWVGGVNDYTAHRKKLSDGARAAFGELNDLRYAAPDAMAISARMEEYADKRRYNYFPANRLELKTNAAAARKPLLDALSDLAKPGAVKPDDVLVLFLAGHGSLIGDTADGQTKAIPDALAEPETQFKNIRFVFCGPEFNFVDPVTTGVPAEVLLDKLVAVNCRKMVFLDVCHAGGIATKSVVRQLLPEGQGPFVFSACGHRELSREDPTARHGLFTESLLEATGDGFRSADRNADNVVTCEELVEYCTFRVADMRLEQMKKAGLNATYSDQTPESHFGTALPPNTAVVKRVYAGR